MHAFGRHGADEVSALDVVVEGEVIFVVGVAHSEEFFCLHTLPFVSHHKIIVGAVAVLLVEILRIQQGGIVQVFYAGVVKKGV